jgi:fermentation-respiration switch protein FrsA (DUF1100 family)
MRRVRPLPRVPLVPMILVVLLAAGCAPAGPAPSAVTSAAGASFSAVSFSTVDGASLTGRVFGAGATGVVLSNMGDNDPAAWEAFAPVLAGRGLLVLTYSFRYPPRTAAFTPAMARATVADLTAAVAYLRGRGASRIVLVGASLGGIATGKVAGPAGAAAVVVLSAPRELTDYDLVVSPAELAPVTAPKLFVASEADDTVPLAATREYYEQAPEPRRFVSFPGTAHGVRILAGPHGDELRALLLDFITQ